MGGGGALKVFGPVAGLVKGTLVEGVVVVWHLWEPVEREAVMSTSSQQTSDCGGGAFTFGVHGEDVL